MVDRLGQSQLEHLGLQSPLEEILWFEGQNVVKLEMGFFIFLTDSAGQRRFTFILSSARTPVLTRRRSKAFPSNNLLGSFSSRVRRSLAADLILARVYLTLQTCHCQSVSHCNVSISLAISSPLSCSSGRTLPPASAPGQVWPSRKVSWELYKSSHTSWESSC